MIVRYSDAYHDAVVTLLTENTPLYFHPSEEAEYREYLKAQVEDYFVLIQNESVVAAGGINYNKTSKVAVLSWDMVDPTMQGQGLGSQLVRYRLSHIRSSRPDYNIIVRTSQHTHEFYAKMGFSLDYIKKDYWAPGMDLYHMTRLDAIRTH